jgi:protein-S-isoprenylcysteine O-methyltransferase Ste14
MATLRNLVGSGDRIALATLPFIVLGVGLGLVNPSLVSFAAPEWFRLTSIVVLVLGAVVWAWTVVLILTNVPKGRLITSGPYAWVKHPLYTSVALLVLPWLGFALETWLGLALGVVLYLVSRRFARDEETALLRSFGQAWRDYASTVKFERV